jgi:glycosyltransferase involved in cell wall biosynthesis
MNPLPLSPERSIIIVSDRIEYSEEKLASSALGTDLQTTGHLPQPAVEGGYLERLPLSCIAAGIVERSEVWHHVIGGGQSLQRAIAHLTYRGVPADGPESPVKSRSMLELFQRHGAPHILVVFGLGIDATLLDACANSVRIYNSIDAPSLRIPEDVSARFDIVLTGAQWQSDEVAARHPGMTTAILPVGPEFAGVDQFRPLGMPKDYDLIYVAAAQPYKRHDLLFDALEQCPHDVRALCVFGYGEMADALRADAAARGLSVDFVGPPGVAFDEVNRLMNRAKFGVVCGRDDGAPAILTEYMLAGLPVLANAELVCGRHYIQPETGTLASPDNFAAAIMTMREEYAAFAPREAVLAQWTWHHSIAKLQPLIVQAQRRKRRSHQHGSVR